MARSLFALAALLLTYAALAAPVPEAFVAGWGRPVDPDKDCKIRRDKGALIIEMPGGDHDFDPLRKRVNAPRLLREIEGDFDLQVRVRIDSLPSAQSTAKDQPSYVAAGFLLIFPDTFFLNFIRMEYRVSGQGDGAEDCVAQMSQNKKGGRGDGIVDKHWPYWPFKAKPEHVYLRLERQGELLGIYFSSDGKKWVPYGGGLKVGLPSKLKVGFVACSTSTDPSKVHFDQLQFIRDKKRWPWEFAAGWGNPVDPDKDCKVQRGKDAFTIEMPGRAHDYDPVRKRFNAPRILSELEGEFDVQVRVRIDYRPSVKSTVNGQPAFVSAGFLLIYPESEDSICARLEYAVSQQGSRAEGYAVRPRLAEPRQILPAPEGKEAERYAVIKRWTGEAVRKGKQIEFDHGQPRLYINGLWERGWEKWPLPEKAGYAYLRLDHRVAGWSSFYISPDGEQWTRLEHLPSLTEGGKLGLAACSTSTEPSKVIFDQLKLARGEKKEDKKKE